ncbi:MAG: UDP-glucose/GDP-mannose dehydrogenase family protein [Alistipes sp.]|nr:UDP-glucose/GDP-mannose dehydrogenase family protein [Alistipes sp.]
MKIVVIGSGYVGLVTGACFAEMGVTVCCVDTNAEKVACLKRGEIPIYEPGLAEMVERNCAAGRLHFTTEIGECADGADAMFIAVGTPSDEDGSADVSYVLGAARSIGRVLNGYTVVVVKSTVPVGTSGRVRDAIREELQARGADVEFDVASNPEFLKEGCAVRDFMQPDRVVVGVESERARKVLAELYKPFMMTADRLLFTDLATSEMTKYTANAMLATRISFMNEIANLCERLGANVDMVRKGIGADVRIGPKFLYAGCGYGGSCFPKDVRALIATAEQNGYTMELLRSVERVNDRQKTVLFDKLCRHFGGEPTGKTVAVWGLAFKPETDDLREAPSLVLVSQLLEAGCEVRIFDPVAMDNGRRLLGDKVTFADDMYAAAAGADALVVVTEWKEFRLPDWKAIRAKMRGNAVIDGRNIYDRTNMAEEGFAYYRIG